MAQRDTAQGNPLPELLLGQLKPYFTVTILECVSDDADEAFDTLIHYLREAAADKGRAIAVNPTGEIRRAPRDHTGADRGIEHLYAITRRRARIPAWAAKDSGIVDSVNELSLALAKGRLVAIRTDMITPASLLRWADHPSTPYRPLAPEILQGAFDGNGTMAWLRGIHRQRRSLPSSKTIGGIRIQDTYDAIEDATFALTAMRIQYLPDEEGAALRGQLTISADRSHLSARAMHDLPMFIAATDESLTILEKCLNAESPPDPTLPGYAVREHDLSEVRGAYDIRVASPEEVLDDPDPDGEQLLRAELLRGVLREVRGNPASSDLDVGIGREGVSSTRLALRLAHTDAGIVVRADSAPHPQHDDLISQVIDAIENTDLLSIYYQSGHTYTNRQIARQTIASPPFRSIVFCDFTGFDIKQEKPVGGTKQIHRRIAREGDISLFSWVQRECRDGWLVCDDGPGEIADFLHLQEDGTLRVIHVKAAHSSSTGRRIAVTSFEQLVSQAEKNIRRLESEVLHSELLVPRTSRPACWTNGQRVDSRSAFLTQLERRTREDKTYVVLVQPHLTRNAYDKARAAMDEEVPDMNSSSLTLLDNLLHSTRRTISSRCDDLIVVASA